MYLLCELVLIFEQLICGFLYVDVEIFLCIVNQIVGMGLLEVILESVFFEWYDLDDVDVDGILGCVNCVWNNMIELIEFGCFGWKVNQLILCQQVVGVFFDDMGIVNDVFVYDDCLLFEFFSCVEGEFDIDMEDFDKVVLYIVVFVVFVQCMFEDLMVFYGCEFFY